MKRPAPIRRRNGGGNELDDCDSYAVEMRTAAQRGIALNLSALRYREVRHAAVSTPFISGTTSGHATVTSTDNKRIPGTLDNHGRHRRDRDGRNDIGSR
jgi:hypothetical protein